MQVCQVELEVYLVVVETHPNTNTIDFVTISSTGDASDFGDLIYGSKARSSLVKFKLEVIWWWL